MLLHEVFAESVARSPRKRIGRGIGSGHGKTCGRGHKGAGSRSGTAHRVAFEGGQTPVFRRVAKRGQSGLQTRVKVVKLDDVSKVFCSESKIDPVALMEKGFLPRGFSAKIVLGVGLNSLGLIISGCKVSRGAAIAVVAGGGSVR